MLRTLLLAINLLFFQYCFAQKLSETASSRTNPFAGYGYNYSPIVSVEVHAIESPVQFLTPKDYSSSQVIPGYFRVTVKSQRPWYISFKFVAIGYDRGEKSVHSLVSLRNPMTGQRIPVSNASQVILQGPGHLGPRDYYLDLVVDAPFDIGPGFYRGLVDFQITQIVAD